MAEAREAFIGIDAAKRRNAVAVADAGREGWPAPTRWSGVNVSA